MTNQITTHFHRTYDLATVWAENQLSVRVVAEPVSAIEQVQAFVVQLFRGRDITATPQSVNDSEDYVGFRFDVRPYNILMTNGGSQVVQEARCMLRDQINRKVTITSYQDSMVVWVARE